ncbi:receptor-type guanylate cyclase Gyc76C-like [Centruroides sculpturatus]|uniref:receptor-type guanylate cyclase Gyc76C-like n=1 Tax=Centruroides sculpturatus TaxID=218467 RepID=UPI000C6E05A2|nr:receptor-type guanylate cyclase Gyc76C-like [Centruroides sculpturatus]
MLYAESLAKVLEAEEDPKNGTNIIQNIIKKKTYQSITGVWMRIDENGDVENNYTVLARQNSPTKVLSEKVDLIYQYTMMPVGNFYYQGDELEPKLRLDKTIDWIGGEPPLDEPPCGYNNNLCSTPSDKNREIIAGVLGSILLSVCLITAITYRNWKYEQEIAGLLWRITFDDMHRQTSNGLLSSNSRSSLSQMSVESKTAGQVFTQIALYRGMWVAVKQFHYHRRIADLSRDTKKEMKILRELHHDNINPFIGACIQGNCIYIVTEYCMKGSLQDILENEDLKLDKIFIASLVSDFIKGMLYLHDSELRVHGNLKSSNCLITSRWVLQVSDFGLHELRSNANTTTITDYEYYRNLLWKAPELLRQTSNFPKISQKGDVYSFAIILHEIMQRQGPFGNIMLPPKDIVLKVMNGPSETGEIFRPSLEELDCQDYIINTIKDCWAEKAENRPDFRQIREKLKAMRQGMKTNIVDNMMEMMEKYANNLEELVDERTSQLQEEQKKTEALLYRMLPKSVAAQLIKGEVVRPESFDAVTIYFSDIVGFTEMSADSTPMEVVTFLNDLYTIFDDIISHYNVYKVETIGDAYMVVSGLPLRNDDLHASEIASMALELLETVKTFKIRHRPNHLLKLRIGIHTGPVVAGVVGLTMPRYCLFGDTVNTASRMESNGEALKIHISLQCRDYLQKLGGYIIEERGIIKMKFHRNYVSNVQNWKYEQEIAGLLWRITFDDMHRQTSNGLLSSNSRSSLSQMSVESKTAGQVFTQIALYRGMWVAVKQFHYHRRIADLSRDTKKEMKILRELHHDNINPFIGACIQGNCIYIVTEYCMKGSLQDILENEDLKLDKIFIASLVSDFIKGMLYLHDSELRVHGNLKSSNCLITSRWVLQVSDFGLHELRSNANTTTITDYEYYRNLLWKAPELLRQTSNFPKISQKGDVYSFAIILHEIMQRQGPFGNIMLPPKDIVLKVMNGPSETGEIFRPSLEELDCQDYIINTIKDCWAEKAENRPDFRQIREKLKAMRQGMKTNIVDNMMEMMEKYANNLEELVDERTSQLQEEQKKTEALLYRMLPKSVAAQLIKGEVVRPESFDAVTIYFSDIVGFTEMSADSTPMEVVTFLNDLYTIFDDIISHYNVYKVETIGDAYMVVSGLPLRNDDLHASEIASMALELLETVKTFKIRHRPNHLLKLRIGIHTGPVVAGVVGLTMPRYCLFGDTVNTASRMESNGEALKIHISLQCRDYLQKLGGYIIEERGIIKMKGKGEVKTFWLLGQCNPRAHRTLPHDQILPQPLFSAVRDSEIRRRSPKLDHPRRGSLAVRNDACHLEDVVAAMSHGSIPSYLRNCGQDSPYNGRTLNTQNCHDNKVQNVEERTEEAMTEIIPITSNGTTPHLEDGATIIPLLSAEETINEKKHSKMHNKYWRSLDELHKSKPNIVTWFAGLFSQKGPYIETHRLNHQTESAI